MPASGRKSAVCLAVILVLACEDDAHECDTMDDCPAGSICIDHVCQAVGDANHVGLGSDFDGGFGAESIPAGMDTIADLGRIAPALGEELGYGDEDIAAIMGGNWLRLLQEALP